MWRHSDLKGTVPPEKPSGLLWCQFCRYLCKNGRLLLNKIKLNIVCVAVLKAATVVKWNKKKKTFADTIKPQSSQIFEVLISAMSHFPHRPYSESWSAVQKKVCINSLMFLTLRHDESIDDGSLTWVVLLMFASCTLFCAGWKEVCSW